MTSLDAPVIGAAIAAAASLVGLIIAKENKTSEFRQAWIDALRADIAEAISAVSILTFVLDRGKDSHHTSEFREAWTLASASLARIELRLNLHNDNDADLLEVIRDTHRLMLEMLDTKYDSAKARQLRNVAVERASVILKREWSRVKDGEPLFSIARWAALLIVFLTAAYILSRT